MYLYVIFEYAQLYRQTNSSFDASLALNLDRKRLKMEGSVKVEKLSSSPGPNIPAADPDLQFHGCIARIDYCGILGSSNAGISILRPSPTVAVFLK